MTARIGCAVLGATGAVGQRFVERLADHPWFALHAVTASERNVGRRYGDVVAALPGGAPVPSAVAQLVLADVQAVLDDPSIPLVFSALPGGTAGPIETRFAEAGRLVCSNARDHRMDPDVPLLIPEVNPQHATAMGPGGGIVSNGNCSGIILTLALAPLQRAFGIASVDVTTMQARSGAGHPDRVELDTAGNVLPFIAGEEEKLTVEPQKTLEVDFPVHATCTRVDVRDGHLESVHVRLRRTADLDAVRDAFISFCGPPEVQGLPSAPRHPIHVLDGEDAPQPKHHVDAEDGMAVTVGRIRVDGDHVRFLLLGHNTVRGAAGQSILNAEFLHAQGLIPLSSASAATLNR